MENQGETRKGRTETMNQRVEATENERRHWASYDNKCGASQNVENARDSFSDI